MEMRWSYAERLLHDAFQRLVVGLYSHLVAIQVLVEPLAAEQYRVQFFFYLCVVLLGIVEAFGCDGDGLVFLEQGCSYAVLLASTCRVSDLVGSKNDRTGWLRMMAFVLSRASR